MKKSLFTLFLALVLAMSSQTVSYAVAERGLFFRSYEVAPTERTSLQIPDPEGRSLSFSDSLHVSFSLKVNLDLGRFGYICRALLSNRKSVDILLYTPSGKPTALCATGDHENMIFLPLDRSGWQDVDLLLTLDKGVVNASMNGVVFASVETGAKHENVVLCFGTSDIWDIATVDAAPMVIRDLNIRSDRSRADFRSLDYEDAYDGRHHRWGSVVTNPLWMMERHRHWNRMYSSQFPSATYACVSNTGVINFISDGVVERYSIKTMSSKRWNTSRNMKFGLLTNDFICLPDGKLAYLDIDVPRLITFDEESGDWDSVNPRSRGSVHLHDNLVFDGEKGVYLSMFGYGQHRYSSEVNVWNPDQGSVSCAVLENIPPRYLAAVGVVGRKAYVFGGKGNSQGAQELGVRLYGDLWTVDMDDFSVQQVWSSDDACQEVAAPELVFDPDGKSFYALVYNPNVYESSLQLKKFDIGNRSSESFGEPIPYNFLDIESEAHLVYSPEVESYLAVVTQKREDGSYGADIYGIGYPLLSAFEGQKNGGRAWGVHLLAALVLSLVICMVAWLLVRRRKASSLPSATNETPAGKQPASKTVVEKPEPGVHLLGGFRVIAADGQDLSGNFSPLMKQLLCIIVLNSGRKGGISNSALKDALWFDKSDESYNNNRGVTLKKIRTILSQVNPELAIVSNKGSWLVEDPDGVCDFISVGAVLSDRKASLQAVLDAASHGPLLPELHFDWLDLFKSDYDYLVISRLSSFRSEISDDRSAEEAIMIADALLSFDRLDESSVRMKCQALLHLKRTGSAKRAFDAYVDDYKRTLDEDFALSFTDFIKNQAR